MNCLPFSHGSWGSQIHLRIPCRIFQKLFQQKMRERIYRSTGMIWKKNTFQEIPLGLPVESPGAFRSWGIFQDPLGGWQRRGTHPTTLMMLGKTAARKRPIGRSDPTVEAIDPNAPISSLLPHMSITNMIIYSQLVIRATGLLQASTTLRGIDSGLFEGSWEGGRKWFRDREC